VDGLETLIERLPPGTVSDHPGELFTHSHDRWAVALLREVRGDRVPPGAALVFPHNTEEVATTLAWADETGTAIVPRGGGTGVTGGAEAIRRSIVLDLTRMGRVLDVDEVSQTVTVQAGTRGKDLERALGRHGLTTGHYPDSYEDSTVGGWIAAASAGYAAMGYGAIEDILLGLTVVLAGGEVVRLKTEPRSAAGPDLRRLFIGSDGTLGVITEATLAVSRLPQAYVWEAVRPHSFETGMALVREIVQRGHRPLVLRLVDEAEAEASFAAFGHRGPVLIAGFDAGAPAVEALRFDLKEIARRMGARSLGGDLAEHWWGHRHDAMRWYEEVMGPDRALGPGILADGMDLASPWRRLPHLYADVRGALLEYAETVTCRLGHPRPSGASLHFSFVVKGPDDDHVEPIYRAAWRDAVSACVAAGGTISHHQGIGLLKAPFLGEELGQEGTDALRRIKAALDPQGLLNPGKLLPPEPDMNGVTPAEPPR
jgi:alkyldihydroxyacetonephosphate synthase